MFCTKIFAAILAASVTLAAGVPALAQAPGSEVKTQAPGPPLSNVFSPNDEISIEQAREALEVYDRLRAADPYGLRSERLDLELKRFTDCSAGMCPDKFCLGPCPSRSNALPPQKDLNDFAIERNKSADVDVYGPVYEDGRYQGDEGERKNREALRKIEAQRQRTFERVADSIAPGLGRVEFKAGSNDVRIDYLYAKRCRVKGIGICLQVRFK